MMCTSDFAKMSISLKAPRGLHIHRIEVKYRFIVHPNINKTDRTKENNIALKDFFLTVLTYFVTGPFLTTELFLFEDTIGFDK